MQVRLDDVKNGLNLPEFDGVAAQRLMMPALRSNMRPWNWGGQPRLGGVLVLLYCYQNELHVLLTRRRDDLNAHAGQISFPGGRCEEGETFYETALRETFEEVGVYPAALAALGPLTQIYILPSDFEVHPFVAWHHDGQRPSFQPNVAEVAHILDVPLSHLLDPVNRKEEIWNLHDIEMDVPFFDFHGEKIWGATAMMLSELLERTRSVIGYR